MAQNPSSNYLGNLRLAALLCVGAVAVLVSLTALGLTRTELYQAVVPGSERSENDRAAAFQAALKIVLVRVTGRRTADADPALAPLLGNARRYVQQYRGTPDNQLWVAFDGGAIERWLTQNGLPLWGPERPATVVWLGVSTGLQAGTVVTADATSDLKTAIDAAASDRGIALIWPTATDLQKNHVDYAALNSLGPAALADIGHHLGGDGVLIGRAPNSTATAAVRWTQLFQDRSGEFSGALEGVNHAADAYAEVFAVSGTLAPVDVEVSGVADLKDYAGVQTYLEGLTFVSHVSVLSLAGDTMRFRLSTRGGIESLKHAFALNGRLQALPAAAADGVQRFQLHR